MSEPSLSVGNRLRDRIRRLRERARKTLPFLSGVLAALLALFLYTTFFPGAKPLTQNEVDAAISSALASATPRPAFSEQVYQIIQPSLVWIEADRTDATGGAETDLGTGVIINRAGDVLTALHVVDRATSIRLTFADGTKALDVVRWLPKCHEEFATFIHGTKCAAKFSGNIHAPDSWLYKDQRTERSNLAWRAPKETVNPWQAEWDVLLSAIRQNKPHNETKRAALSNLGSIMGRAAVHTGKIVTWEDAMASSFQFCANVDGLTEKSPAPVQADAQGRYAAPIPGRTVEI